MKTPNKVTFTDVLNLHLAEVGYKETPINYTKYADEFYGYHISAEWCAIYQNIIFKHAGLPLPYKTASCRQFRDWCKRNNCWVTSGYKNGDVAVVTTKSGNHMVFLAKVYTNGADTIEGNWNDSVSKYYRPFDSKFQGAYHPLYDEEEEDLTREETIALFNQVWAEKEAERHNAPPSSWSAEDRAWAEENGIIAGDSTGMHYKDYCTREQMTAFLHREDSLIRK